MADSFEKLTISIMVVGIAVGGLGAFSYVSIMSNGTGPIADINYTAGIMIVGFAIAIIGGVLEVIRRRVFS